MVCLCLFVCTSVCGSVRVACEKYVGGVRVCVVSVSCVCVCVRVCA